MHVFKLFEDFTTKNLKGTTIDKFIKTIVTGSDTSLQSVIKTSTDPTAINSSIEGIKVAIANIFGTSFSYSEGQPEDVLNDTFRMSKKHEVKFKENDQKYLITLKTFKHGDKTGATLSVLEPTTADYWTIIENNK